MVFQYYSKNVVSGFLKTGPSSLESDSQYFSRSGAIHGYGLAACPLTSEPGAAAFPQTLQSGGAHVAARRLLSA